MKSRKQVTTRMVLTASAKLLLLLSADAELRNFKARPVTMLMKTLRHVTVILDMVDQEL